MELREEEEKKKMENEAHTSNHRIFNQAKIYLSLLFHLENAIISTRLLCFWLNNCLNFLPVLSIWKKNSLLELLMLTKNHFQTFFYLVFALLQFLNRLFKYSCVYLSNDLHSIMQKGTWDLAVPHSFRACKVIGYSSAFIQRQRKVNWKKGHWYSACVSRSKAISWKVLYLFLWLHFFI